ncbi:hypothetical protein BH20ACT2_BH20ACT2_14870 [soil metagenome]
MREISAYSSEFRDRLAHLGLQPVLIGALAAIRYRLEPRETTDVDFLTLSLDGLAEAMRADGHDVRVMAEPGGEPYVVFIRGKGVAVDVLLAETEYQLEAHGRAVDGVLTVEDVIVHKLLAWRARDRDDVDSILAVGHDLDEAYIEQWAEVWEVSERWVAAKRSRA